MKTDRKYIVAVAFLAVLAIAFGVFGTVAPPLAEEGSPVQLQQESSSESVGHFANPPTYDSGWVDIHDKCGQYFSLKHNLNTTDVVVDVSGKVNLDPIGGGAPAWTKTFGGIDGDYGESVVQTGDEGYALAGYTSSYGAGLGDFWLVKTDADGNAQWNKTYGGTGSDVAYSVVQTVDGGYALAGYTDSIGVGSYDFWLVKTDADGNTLWNKTYGGTNYDYARSVVQTGDGGYALAGYTNSYGAGGYDFWLVKTDAAGNALWSRTFGGTGNDVAYSVVQTVDGGYALAGYTNSFGAGGADFWLVKTDSDGNMVWSKTYGGTSGDAASSVVQTLDGGYALAGYTNSYGAGGYDFWLVKTDAAGNALWNRTYGGTNYDYAYSVVQTVDEGYALAGVGNYDFWLVRVKPEMNLEHQRNLGGTNLIYGWSKTYGGANTDFAYSVVQTGDGGYALAGSTESFGAGGDFYLVKTDAAGTMQWSKTYGVTNYDYARSMVQTVDGGYALAGYTYSSGAGGDFYLVKTDAAGNMQWSKTYGGADEDAVCSVVQTGDGGYALAGSTESFGAGAVDFWLVKTDADGNALWNRTYGGTNDDYARSLVQTLDGGYALAGCTESFGAGAIDFYLVKTDADGNLQWNRTYGGTDYDPAESMVQTVDGGYALAGYNYSYSTGNDFWLVKTDAAGSMQWNKTYGGTNYDYARSVVQTSDGGYALAGYTYAWGGDDDFWSVQTDSAGNALWNKTYGGTGGERALSLVQTGDGGYALAGYTNSFGAGGYDFWLVKTDVEMGLTRTGLTNKAITLYRGRTDPYWNYVRVRIWLIKEPTWIYGDINMDGTVDAKDLYIIGRNYGKTFSILSLTGIVAVAGIRAVKKRKQNRQPRHIS